MNSLVDNSMIYSGEVEISLRIGNKNIKKKVHNSGTMLLKRAFAMFMCGGMIADQAKRYIPTKLDLRYENMGTWSTNLNRPIYVTNPSYAKDELSAEPSWYVEYSAVMPYSAMISGIDVNKTYRFYLMCDSNLSDEGSDIAYISVSGTDLATLEAGVSAIISWRLRLLNSRPE